MKLSKNDKGKDDLVRTAVYLPPGVHETLRELAFRKRTTISNLIRQAITVWLDVEARRK